MPLPRRADAPPRHWTHTYFGSIYGELYRKHLIPAARTREEAAFVDALLGPGRQRVLDIAAGFGRHARILARRHSVLALDTSAAYLRTALERLPARSRLAAVQGDMRALPFASASCDAALLLFNSFGYFGSELSPQQRNPLNRTNELVYKLPTVYYERGLVGEDFGRMQPQMPAGRRSAARARTGAQPAIADWNQHVLEEVARVLRPGGQFLIEVPNPRPFLEAIRESPRIHQVTARYEIEEEFEYDERARIVWNRTRFRLGRETETAQYFMRLYTRADLSASLRAAGLRPAGCWGNYRGEPFRARDSDMILLLGRNGAARAAK